MDNCLKYFLFIITVKKPQNGLKFREIVANSSLIIPHIILLQFVLILGAVTPKNSSCPNLIFCKVVQMAVSKVAALVRVVLQFMTKLR